MKLPGKQRAFTLFEVLVALAIMTFGLAALWKGLDQSIFVAGALPERIAARWVAQNRLVLRQARTEWPQPKVFRGKAKMDGREWHWLEKIQATQDPLIRKITVSVSAGEKSTSLYSIDGYLRRPSPRQRGTTALSTSAGNEGKLQPAGDNFGS